MARENRIKRKEFIARFGKSVIGLGLGVSCRRPAEQKNSAAADPPAEKSSGEPAFRTIGKAKIRVTEVGFGASRTMDPTLINHAFERGINFFDTGRSYYNGQNEILMGKVFKDRRQQVVINSKLPPNPLDRMRRDLDTSLKALDTDYIDCLLIHGASKPEEIQGDEVLELLTVARDQGKIRTFGFSSHSNFIELLNLAAGMKFHEVILVPYNFLGSYTHMLGGGNNHWDADLLEKAIRKCGEAGIDFISMKGCSGGYLKDSRGNNSYAAALKWILKNPYLKTTATAMGNFQQIEENVTAMGAKGLGAADQEQLKRYAGLYGSRYCRMCGGCRGKCLRGVDVATVNRLQMYAESYGGDMRLEARASYAALGDAGAAACAGCAECKVDCPWGLPLSAKLKQAHRVLS